jgi:radical SAM protein with 4Fe4S-binding SPASM domain
MRLFAAYLPYLSLKKIINFYLIQLSYFISSFLQKNIHFGNPYFLTLEPTTACNLRCPQCPSGIRSFTRETGNLKKETLQRVLNETKDFIIHIQFYFQGEPLIHPNITDYIHTVHLNKIFTSLSTNAHFITAGMAEKLVLSGLDEIIISMDGTTQDTYEKYRIEGEINKVKEGISQLVEAKVKFGSKRPFIKLQFLVFKHNEHQVDEFIKYYKKAGADSYSLKGPQIYDFENADDIIPLNQKFARYHKINGEWKIKNTFKNKCKRMWFGSVITWDGNVVPCCFDKDASYKMGNLNIQKWDEIIKGKSYSEFRQRLLKNRKEIDICRNCTEGTEGVY